MVVDKRVEEYMKAVGLKYIKNAQEFIAGLAVKTNKNYAKEVAATLNSRAKGEPVSNSDFYALKNESLEGSLYISAAFDGGVFRHIGNIILENPDYFKGNVLDCGCDCGIVTCFMAKMYPDCNFTGIDINERAVKNGQALAEKLGLKNVSFKTADVYNYEGEEKYSLITSFRALLDIAEKETKGLAFFGEREEREKMYCDAFSKYADFIANHLEENGAFLSVERYTAEYGWLGWLKALEKCSLYADRDKCMMMSAQDISSKKEYSVTAVYKKDDGAASMDIFNDVMSRGFKSSTGYDGAMAEFAMYYDSDGGIEFTDIYKKGRLIRQFGFAKSKNGKNMYYEADCENRKIKYYNDKKEAAIKKDYEQKIELYKDGEFSLKTYKIEN